MNAIPDHPAPPLDCAGIAALAALLRAAGLRGADIAGPSGRLRLRLAAMPAATPPPRVVAARGIGHFLTAHPARPGALAPVGSRVQAGAVLGLLQAGSLLTPVLAPADGWVEAVLAPEETLAGYDTPLFRMVP